MADRSSSPFTGLDKALVRSTKIHPTADAERAIDQTPKPTPVSSSREQDVFERTNERISGRNYERTNERTKVRHSFDVYQDQLLQLSDVQADIYRRTGKKPKVGELVQQALDAYIERYRERTNERTVD